MKNILIVFCLLILSFFNAYSDCKHYCVPMGGSLYPQVTEEDLNDIVKSSSINTWVVGNSGTIISTTNNFYTTAFQESNTNEDLLSISLVNSNLLWVSGNNGTILKTTNGGNTWSQYITNLTDNITCIDFANENVGWAIGSNGNILRTTDSGENWEIFSNIEYQGLKRICVIDTNNAWAVGSNGKILKLIFSNNNINSISYSISGLTKNLSDVSFWDTNVGWVIGDSCANFKTTDGGNTWVSLPKNDYIPSFTKYKRLFIFNQDFVYISSNQGLLFSDNGGLSWGSVLEGEMIYSSTNSFYLFDGFNGYSVGSDGDISTYYFDYCYTTYCLDSPVNGATEVSINPVLTWERIWGHTIIYIEVATDSLFENIVSYEYNSRDFIYLPGPLEYSTTYYWRMKMFENGDWSDVWSFSTEAPPPITNLDISLSTGWNLISSNIITEEPAMENVFEGMNNIVLVKNGIGQIYSPAFGINQIGVWNINDGYYVYTNSSSILNISGTEVNPVLQGIQLNAGWNLVSYLRNSPMNVQQALSSITSNLIMAKNNSGGIFHPGFGINTLGDMQPRQGYWLYITAPTVLTYPGND